MLADSSHSVISDQRHDQTTDRPTFKSPTENHHTKRTVWIMTQTNQVQVIVVTFILKKPQLIPLIQLSQAAMDIQEPCEACS